MRMYVSEITEETKKKEDWTWEMIHSYSAVEQRGNLTLSVVS